MNEQTLTTAVMNFSRKSKSKNTDEEVESKDFDWAKLVTDIIRSELKSARLKSDEYLLLLKIARKMSTIRMANRVIIVRYKTTVKKFGKCTAWAISHTGKVYKTNSRSRWVLHTGAYPQSLKEAMQA